MILEDLLDCQYYHSGKMKMVSDRTKVVAAGGVILLFLIGAIRRAQAAPVPEPEPVPMPEPELPMLPSPMTPTLGKLDITFVGSRASTELDGRIVTIKWKNNDPFEILFNAQYIGTGPSGLVLQNTNQDIQLLPGEEISVDFEQPFTEGRPPGTKYIAEVRSLVSVQDQTAVAPPQISNFIFR